MIVVSFDCPDASYVWEGLDDSVVNKPEFEAQVRLIMMEKNASCAVVLKFREVTPKIAILRDYYRVERCQT